MKSLRITFLVAVVVSGAMVKIIWAQGFNPTAKFYAAGLAYKDGRYQQAIDDYKAIIDNGLMSAAVYYNLANSYFKNQQLGRAVLSYERARRLKPRDEDILSNYAYALEQVQEVAVPQPSLIGRILRSYSENMSVDEFVWGLYGVGFFMGALYLLGLFLKWPKRTVIVVFVALASVFLSQTGLLFYKINSQKNLAVVVESTQCRYEPVDKSTAYFPLPEGNRVRIQEEYSGWAKVERWDGKVGWVPQDTLEKI